MKLVIFCFCYTLHVTRHFHTVHHTAHFFILDIIVSNSGWDIREKGESEDGNEDANVFFLLCLLQLSFLRSLHIDFPALKCVDFFFQRHFHKVDEWSLVRSSKGWMAMKTIESVKATEIQCWFSHFVSYYKWLSSCCCLDMKSFSFEIILLQLLLHLFIIVSEYRLYCRNFCPMNITEIRRVLRSTGAL